MSTDGSAAMTRSPLRPPIAGTRHGISAGHYLAAEAGFAILEDGGNAIDAGVAAVIALAVVQSNFVNVAGVAPIILYSAKHDEVVTIDGVGTWPAAATLALFEDEHGGTIPEGLLRTVVPAAPDAWITALERYGTISFADAARAAIRFAAEGFIMYPMMSEQIAEIEHCFTRWPSSAAVYLPGGAPPVVGEKFVQTDLGRTLQYLADEEAASAAKQGRGAGLEAARGAFYRGDIARTVCAYHVENGGLLTMDDMAGYRVSVEPPVQVRFGDGEVYACGPWCQGPVLLQALGILDGFDLKALGHNTPEYVHTVIEATKLSCADRERYYGDPKFVDVPMERLLSPDYAAERRALIRSEAAFPELPPPGAVAEEAASPPPPRAAEATAGAALDTSYASVVDRQGNVFSATPSDVAHDTPVIPGTGLCVSSRGAQSWAVSGHASAVAPCKRPRLTPNPALALGPDGLQMPLGTPGGDVQSQAMLQTFINHRVFGMDVQQAVEAPRFASLSFPNSFEPHTYLPGRLQIERRLAETVADDLAARGHDVAVWDDWTWLAGSMCTIAKDRRSGHFSAGADPRRPAYALGW